VVLLLFLLLARIPLLNYLGFEYSVAVALVVPWVIAIRAIRLFRSRPSFGDAFSKAMIQGLAILLVPLAVATANLAFVRNCSYGEGLLFYMLIPGVTLFWSVALAGFCASAFRRSRREPFLAYGAVLVLCLLYPLYIGYSSPQIFSYNFIYGFFPGFSYDEVLRITPVFLLFRLYTIAVGFLLLICAKLLSRQRASGGIVPAESTARLPSPAGGMYALAGLLGIMVALGWAFRVSLGFETTRESLERALPAVCTTEHFRIHYSPESITRSEIDWIAALHEFRYSQVEAALQVRSRGQISSYVYPDGETKLRLIGTRTTNIAKPWRHEIHLEKGSLESTLKHELVHVLAGEFGLPVIRAHYNIGLVEGLAMEVDGDFGNRTLDQYAAAVKKFNLVPDPARLIKPVGFAMKASTVSYVLMGSFCRYLIGRYGIVLFKRLYSGKSPEDVYGKPYDDLIAEWQGYLSRFDIPDAWRSHVEYYFNRPSIFAKECAREVAKLNEEGYRDLAVNKAAAAMSDFSAALSTSWNSESYAGLIRASFGSGRYDTVVQLVDARLSDTLSRSGFINLNVVYGDALWQKGEVDSARNAYRDLLACDLFESASEAASVRLAATSDGALRPTLADYAAGLLTDSSALSLLGALRHETTNPIVPFLEGRTLLRQKRFAEAIRALLSVTGKLDSPILNARAEQLAAQACFQSRKFQPARAHFWQSLNFITNEASADRVQDWIDRCDWFDKNSGRYLGSQ
jgi:tetratricopeptide (TPR) repeat protein